MKFKGTYILAILTLLLGVYIYFFEFRKVEIDKIAKEQSEKILIFEPEKVRKVTLSNSFGKYVLEKDAQNIWQVVSPIKDLADEAAIQTLLTTVSNEKYDQIVSEEGENLDAFGLDKPKLKMEIYFNNGDIKTLLVGSDAAIAGKLYVQKQGDKKVLFANQNIKYQIEKPPRELRDKKILKKNREQLHSVLVKSSRGSVTLLQKDKKWWVDKPFQGLADPEAILTFFNSLESLRASDFSSEKPNDTRELSKFGLDKPLVQIEFYDKPGHIFDVLTLSSKKENNSYIKLKNGKSIYQVFSNTAEPIAKNADDFRDRKSFFEFLRPAVEKISVKMDLARYDFVKKNGTWELTPSDPKKQASQNHVVELINRFTELKVTEFTDSQTLGKAKGQVIFKNEKDEVLIDFQWGEKSVTGKSILAVTQKTKRPIGVDPQLISSLPGQTLVEEKK